MHPIWETRATRFGNRPQPPFVNLLSSAVLVGPLPLFFSLFQSARPTPLSVLNFTEKFSATQFRIISLLPTNALPLCPVPLPSFSFPII